MNSFLHFSVTKM